MTERAFRALVGVEFQRCRQFAVGLGITALTVVVVFAVTRWNIVFLCVLLSGMGASLAFQVAIEGIKDKVTGSLELLTTLPVSASTLAAARLAATVLLSILGAVLIAGAAGVAGDQFVADTSPVRIMGVSFLFASILLSASAGAAVGLALRFKAKTIATYGLLVVVAGTFAVVQLYDWLFGSPLRAIQAIMASDHTLVIATAMALVASALVLAGSFLLARQGLERYEPELDAVDW